MSVIITVEEAQINLKDLIDQVIAGQEIIITEDGKPVARLVSELPKKKLRPPPGLGKGSIIYMAPDCDAPLEDFKEYMP
ncbi:MAG: type II toxin-antitoxin system Phd/YefM family antitoxin [Candidatus Competibacteraceae bacterium]